MDALTRRAITLSSLGATPFEVEELLAYSENLFRPERLEGGLQLPLEPEAHVSVWREYAAAVTAAGSIEPLREALVQLQFPIRMGISLESSYQAATRRGIVPASPEEPLAIRGPVRLVIHDHAAGPLPAFLTTDRDDFVSLVRAFTASNEPTTVPPSQGAAAVSGFNNWDRIRRHRREWERTVPDATADDWRAEFKRLGTEAWRYQDRFLIVSDGPYSAVPAEGVGCSESEWRTKSVALRLEHQGAKYFMRRVFGMMEDRRVHDELIADWAGIRAVSGTYRSDWFLRFMGLEGFPTYRAGGRLENYSDAHFELSDGGFRILQALTVRASQTLERFEQGSSRGGDEHAVAVGLVALASLRLDEIASDDGAQLLRDAHDRALRLVRWRDAAE
jgi:hypothetical protein